MHAHVLVYLCVHERMSACYGIHIEVRGHLAGVGYLLPLCGSRDPTSAISAASSPALFVPGQKNLEI